jgi:hypothetical protein
MPIFISARNTLVRWLKADAARVNEFETSGHGI